MQEFGIVANVEGDKHFREGAKVTITWLNPGDPCSMVGCFGLSRGGRRITKIINIKKLKNFRAKWIPEKIRDHKKAIWAWFESKENADSYIREHYEKSC